MFIGKMSAGCSWFLCVPCGDGGARVVGPGPARDQRRVERQTAQCAHGLFRSALELRTEKAIGSNLPICVFPCNRTGK